MRYGSSGQGQRAPWPQSGGHWCYQPLQHTQTEASVPVLRGGTRAQELCDCYSAIVGLETQIKACQQRHGRCHVPQAALCNHKDIAEAAPRHGPAMLDVMLTMLADEHTRCRLLEQRMSSTLSRTALDVPSTCPALTTCSVTEQHRRGSTSAPALIEGPESPNVGVASSFRQSSASTIEPARARVGSGMESSRVDNVARNGVALQQGSGRALLHAMGKGQDKSQSTEKGESEKASAAAAVLTAWMLASSTPARKDDPAVVSYKSSLARQIRCPHLSFLLPVGMREQKGAGFKLNMITVFPGRGCSHNGSRISATPFECLGQ